MKSLNGVALNTASNVALMAIQLAATFVVTPVYITALGNHDYGLWEMVASLVGYMGILELGLSPTISRFVAKFDAEGDAASFRSLVATSAAVLGIGGIIGSTVILSLAFWSPEALAESTGDPTRYLYFCALVAMQVATTIPGRLPESLLEGLQLYWAKNLITAVAVLVGATVTYIYIRSFDPLIFLAAANAIGTALKYAAFVFLAWSRIPPGPAPLWRQASRRMLNQIGSFGLKSFVQGLSGGLEAGAPPLLIGFALGPAAVPFYSLPANLAKYIRNFSWTLTHAFMPLFSDLDARDERNRSRDVYLAGSRLVVVLLIPLSVGACVVGSDFLGLWIGADFERAAAPLMPWVVTYFMFPSINPLSSRYLTAKGAHGYLARLFPVVACCSLSLAVAGGLTFGLQGLAIGLCIPGVIATALVLRRVSTLLGISSMDYIRAALWPAVVPVALMALFVTGWRVMAPIESWTSLSSCVAGAAVVYGLALWHVGLTAEDRNRLRQVLSSFRRPTRR